MKVSTKVAAVLVVAALIFGGIQTSVATPIDPDPSSIWDWDLRDAQDAEKVFDLAPNPCRDSTLLMNEKIYFVSSLDGEKIVLKNAKGKVIFEQAVIKDKKLGIVKFALKPSDLKLKTKQQYSWGTNECPDRYTFTILDNKTEKEILAKLAELETENISPEQIAVNKAKYLQDFSDNNSKDIDLYWLSAQLMFEISPTDENIKKEKEQILKKCNKHLNISVSKP